VTEQLRVVTDRHVCITVSYIEGVGRVAGRPVVTTQCATFPTGTDNVLLDTSEANLVYRSLDRRDTCPGVKLTNSQLALSLRMHGAIPPLERIELYRHSLVHPDDTLLN
jgi:hypothetical protein